LVKALCVDSGYSETFANGILYMTWHMFERKIRKFTIKDIVGNQLNQLFACTIAEDSESRKASDSPSL
jgi:hypothetical protein